MDLTSLKPSKADTGATLTLLHPATDAPLPVTITLLGQDSQKYRALERKKKQANLDSIIKGKKAAALNAERLDAEDLDDLVALTVTWSGVEFDGEPKPCTTENVRRLYTELSWVKEQAQAFINERANFF